MEHASHRSPMALSKTQQLPDTENPGTNENQALFDCHEG